MRTRSSSGHPRAPAARCTAICSRTTGRIRMSYIWSYLLRLTETPAAAPFDWWSHWSVGPSAHACMQQDQRGIRSRPSARGAFRAAAIIRGWGRPPTPPPPWSGRSRSVARRLGTVVLVFFAVLMTRGRRRSTARRRGCSRGTCASRTCPRPRPCSTATRRTRRSTTRSSRIRRGTSIRRSSSWRSSRSRRSRSTSRAVLVAARPARAARAHAARARHARRSLLRRGAPLGPVRERRAAREHLDPARVRGCRRVAVPGHASGRPAWRSGSRSRRSS